MEDNKRTEESDKKESDIIFSKAIKAGKRIYYLDVKKNKKDEFYVAITESKRVYSSAPEDHGIQFEKHKIFLYHEDFAKFEKGFKEIINYISNTNKETSSKEVAEKVDSTDISF